MTSKVSVENLDYLNIQEELLTKVIDTLQKNPIVERANMAEVQRTINDLKEEIKVGKSDDLPGLFYQLNLQYTLAERFSKPRELPDTSAPYFGHMRLLQDGKTKDIYLGHVSYLNSKENFRIVDWKSAPISSIFYQYEEGESFELDLPDREISGEVLQLSIITIDKGKLHRIDRAGSSFIKDGDKWITLDSDEVQFEGGAGSAYPQTSLGTGRTNFNAPDVVSLLDKDQYELLNKDASKPLLLIGGAGSGKTTVALHRIAQLCGKKKLWPNEVIVLVPHKGLIRLSQKILSGIGLHKIKVKASDDWLQEQATRLLKNIPKRVCQSTPISSSIIKRHITISKILNIYIEEKKIALAAKLTRLPDGQEIIKVFNKYNNLPSYQKLNRIEVELKLNPLNKMAIAKEKEATLNIIEDLYHIFTNKKLLEKLKDYSHGKITQNMLETTYYHASAQIRSVEDDSRDGLDGQDINSASVAGTIDQEDFAILLKLLELQVGDFATTKSQLKKYKHIVMDEAQELAPIELNIFGKLLKSNGSVTIAGDSAQQVDETTSFTSWADILKHLGLQAVGESELKVSYRSPQHIVEFAHYVLGPIAPTNMPKSTKQGRPVIKTQVQHHAHASMILYEALDKLYTREPNASLAIICAKASCAEKFYKELRDIGNVRLIHDAEFSFTPGIDITTVEQVKGLEFDYVVIPDADMESYPDRPRARKRMHLAATRAIHQLWVMYPSNKSIMIP